MVTNANFKGQIQHLTHPTTPTAPYHRLFSPLRCINWISCDHQKSKKQCSVTVTAFYHSSEIGHVSGYIPHLVRHVNVKHIKHANTHERADKKELLMTSALYTPCHRDILISKESYENVYLKSTFHSTLTQLSKRAYLI